MKRHGRTPTAQKRNTHKRKAREKYINDLLKSINDSGVGTDHLTYREMRENTRKQGKKTNKRAENFTRGVFSASKSGFGFVKGEDGYEKDVFIPQSGTLGAIDGDTVEISYHVYRDSLGTERTEGRVLKIVEYGRRTLIGTVAYRKERFRGRSLYVAYLIPDDKRAAITPYINDVGAAREGDKVEILLERKNRTGEPEGRVITVFGETLGKDANYAAILSDCEIPTDFTPEELAEAETVAALPIDDTDRVRFDREVIFTIDSESAKDLDDAVSVRRRAGGGWRLSVHIADVSHYVAERGCLDRAVMRRGTSVYFVDKVVPMLPQCLSNGACSLNPGEEKYALTAVIDLDEKGDIISCDVYPSIIKSRVKGVYKEVNSIFENNADPHTVSKYKQVLPSLMRMRELYLVLKKKSDARGALDLEMTESEMLLDERGEVVGIEKRERGDAERMIEQFMLTANEAVARFLHDRGIPCVYRVHDEPPEDKRATFAEFASNIGLKVGGIKNGNADAKVYSALLEEARERDVLTSVSYTMLRSMAKAKYSEEMSPHFGLALDSYCHFTSPIRRLSDLATHRIIHKVVLEGKRPELYASYAKRAAAAATECEIRAVTAERRIENLYKTLHMSKFIGTEFDAVITSVTSFGFFAKLDNTCEGLVPIGSLCGVFTFDERTLCLRSRDAVYRLGDRVRVRLEEADVIAGKLSFSLVDGERR